MTVNSRKSTSKRVPVNWIQRYYPLGHQGGQTHSTWRKIESLLTCPAFPYLSFHLTTIINEIIATRITSLEIHTLLTTFHHYHEYERLFYMLVLLPQQFNFVDDSLTERWLDKHVATAADDEHPCKPQQVVTIAGGHAVHRSNVIFITQIHRWRSPQTWKCGISISWF